MEKQKIKSSYEVSLAKLNIRKETFSFIKMYILVYNHALLKEENIKFTCVCDMLGIKKKD